MVAIGAAYLNDEPAAAQLWLAFSGVASIFKICLNERFEKLLVGTVLPAKMFQYALDVDTVSEVDNLRRDDALKRHWMLNSRER